MGARQCQAPPARRLSARQHARSRYPVPRRVPCRLALASASASLWRTLSASPALWGEARLAVQRQEHEASAALWLARRRGALRRLQLFMWARRGQLAVGPAAEALAGCAGLTALRWHGDSFSLGGGGLPESLRLLTIELLAPPRAFAPRLPPDSSCRLTALRELEIRLRSTIAAGPPEGLTQFGLRLPPAVTALRISSDGFTPCLFGALCAHTRLRELRLFRAGERQAGLWARAAEQLGALPCLTALALGRIPLEQLPRSWSALRALRTLEFDPCCDPAKRRAPPPECRLAGAAALEPFARLTGLTSLRLVQCGLAGLPPELSVLGGLRDLELRFCRWGHAAPCCVLRCAALRCAVRCTQVHPPLPGPGAQQP